jgi:hypothetical protein
MIDIRDFSNLPSGSQQILVQFLANENQSESPDQLADALWMLILQLWRSLHQLPVDAENHEIDSLLIEAIDRWDSDEPAFAIIEKVLKRLAKDRGLAALNYLEQSIKNKSQEFSKLQSARARAPRQRDNLSPLIKDFVTRHPNGSAKKLLAELKRHERGDIIEAIEEGAIYLRGQTDSIPISGLKDRLHRARREVKSR